MLMLRIFWFILGLIAAYIAISYLSHGEIIEMLASFIFSAFFFWMSTGKSGPDQEYLDTKQWMHDRDEEWKHRNDG